MSWKDTLYIGDWSPLAKFRVKGPDALKFFSAIAVNSFAKYAIGQAKHIVLCNNGGKIMGEGVLMKFADDDCLFTSGPGVAWADYCFRKGNYNAEATQIGPHQFILQQQGPNSLFVMEKAASDDLRDIGFMRFRETSIDDKKFLALRQGMAGEVGYEMHGPIEDAQTIYRTLWDIELGWKKNIKFDHDFIGRAALKPEVLEPKRRMATLVWNDEDVADVYASLFKRDSKPYLYMEMPRNTLGCVFADKVMKDGKAVGISTSRCYSYSFREMLSFCVLDVALCQPDSDVTVVWGRPGMPQKHIRAKVAPAPYKHDNRRADCYLASSKSRDDQARRCGDKQFRAKKKYNERYDTSLGAST